MSGSPKEKGFNVHAVFRSISTKLRADFDASAQIRHSGGKGSSREGACRSFLETYLPDRYAIGHGEILHWTNYRSRQCDVVIYDRAQCPRLLADDEHSVFPLESVYGTVEVKSVLSHGELADAFENIVSVKRLVPEASFTLARDGFARGLARPYPYGAVFAYSADRSLEAIHAQLTELEGQLAKPAHAPDAIVILGAGIVSRRVTARRDFNQVNPAWLTGAPVQRKTGEQTLLRWYLEMLGELNAISLEPLNLERYTRMPEMMDGHRVSGHGRLAMLGADRRPTGSVKKVGPSGIKKILAYCESQGTVTMAQHVRDLVRGQLADDAMPPDMLTTMVYVYNPRQLRAFDAANPSAPSITPVQLTIDGANYMVDLAALDPGADFMDDEDAVFDDLFNG